MTKSVNNILLEYGIQNPELSQKLYDLISKGIRASKEFGKKCVILSPGKEEQVYDMFMEFTKEYIESDGSIFASQNLIEFNEKYGLYERPKKKNKV